MPTNWTPEQHNAIHARAARDRLGSGRRGKTAVLTERAVSLLTDPARQSTPTGC